MDKKLDNNFKDVERLRHLTASIQSQIIQLELRQTAWLKNIQESQAGLAKILSSIELELLMQRNACLDNNSEGKDSLEELKQLCYSMAYGDDSKETWGRYCELAGISGTKEELEEKRIETFHDP